MKSQKTMITLVGLGVMTLVSIFISPESRFFYNVWITIAYSFILLAFVSLYVRNKERVEKKNDKPLSFIEYMNYDKAFFMLTLALLSFGLKLLFRVFNHPQAELFQLFTSFFIVCGVLINSKERKKKKPTDF